MKAHPFGVAKAEPEQGFTSKGPHNLHWILKYEPAETHAHIRQLYEHPCVNYAGVFTEYEGRTRMPNHDLSRLEFLDAEVLTVPYPNGIAYGRVSLFCCFDGWRYSYHTSRWLAHRHPKPTQPGDLHNTVGGNHTVKSAPLPSREACLEKFIASSMRFLVEDNRCLEHPDTPAIKQVLGSWKP